MSKGGRPSKLDSISLVQVEKLAKAGWTDVQMSDFFGVSERTWNTWKGKNSEFLQSLKEGKSVSDQNVVRSLYERAIGYSHPEDKIFNNNGKKLIVPTIKHYPPDTTAAIFWLKNRQPAQWRDKQEVEHSSPDGSMSPVTRIEIVAGEHDSKD